MFLEFSSLRILNLFLGVLNVSGSVSGYFNRSYPPMDHSSWPLYLPTPRDLLGMLTEKVTSLASSQDSHYSNLECGNDLLD
jgi:hypothetical protein